VPQLERTEIHFISDLGRFTWTEGLADAKATAAFRKRTARLSEQGPLIVWDVGELAADNSAVSDLRLTQRYAALGAEVEFEAQLEHFGREDKPRQRVMLFVDGRLADEDRVDLPARVAQTARFQHRFSEAGEHHVEIRLADDLLNLDNRRRLALPVKEAIRVLCVNGSPAGDPFQGATEYLRIALNPTEARQGGATARPEVVTENALLEIADLNQYDCMFICNVSRFTKAEARRLDAYLRNGGGLVFFLGDRVLPESYNRWLFGEDPQGVRILPAKIGSRLVRRTGEEPFHIDVMDSRHPLLGAFRGNPSAAWSRFPVTERFQLETPETTTARVAMGIQGGGPLIVEHSVRRGRVILVGVSADASWSTLPKSPNFVPLIHEMLNFVVGRRDEGRNRLVGQDLSGGIRASAGQSVTIQPPSGRTEKLSLSAEGETSRFSYDQTSLSGLYTVRIGPPDSRDELFAVNVDTRESDLAKLDFAELKQEVWPDPIQVHSEPPDLGSQWTTGLSGTSKGNWSVFLLYAVLGLLFFETLIAWRFAHHS
ncbi:MAG: hypothetical protein N2C14_07260, partial [Planctomycetales bacterium]